MNKNKLLLITSITSMCAVAGAVFALNASNSDLNALAKNRFLLITITL